jgi:uroporphyrinogen-III synthase
MNLCLITRAQPGADATAASLRDLGFDAIPVPAAIVQATNAAILIEGVQALLMTSAAAARNTLATPELKRLPVYAVGDATAASAVKMGYENVISAGGDGAALAVLAADRMDPSAGALLHLRGQEVAGDVTGMLTACGFQTRLVEVYQTHDHPSFGDDMRAYLRESQGLVLFHSPAGARRFEVAAAQHDLDLSVWHGVGLSSACLGPLDNLGFGSLSFALRPDEEALIEAVTRYKPHSRP